MKYFLCFAVIFLLGIVDGFGEVIPNTPIVNKLDGYTYNSCVEFDPNFADLYESIRQSIDNSSIQHKKKYSKCTYKSVYYTWKNLTAHTFRDKRKYKQTYGNPRIRVRYVEKIKDGAYKFYVSKDKKFKYNEKVNLIVAIDNKEFFRLNSDGKKQSFLVKKNNQSFFNEKVGENSTFYDYMDFCQPFNDELGNLKIISILSEDGIVLWKNFDLWCLDNSMSWSKKETEFILEINRNHY